MKIPRLAAVLLLSAWPLAGQQYEVYRQFVWPYGATSEALTLGSDGNLYGTAVGGDFGLGRIFRLIPDGNGGVTYELLYSFHGPEGSVPVGVLQGSDGRLYGTTQAGGQFDSGTVYAFDLAQHVLVVFHSFPQDPFYGPYLPSRLVQASDGNLYGTTRTGGTNVPLGYGTLYRVTPAGEFTELHSFTQPEGESPGPLIQASDGYLYGGAQLGGTGGGAAPDGSGYSGGGTIFRSDLAGNVVAIYSFPGSNNLVNGDLVEGLDGNLYGTMFYGGASGSGAAFRSDKSGASVVMIHSFPSSPDDGVRPGAGFVRTPDGTLYGIASGGGAEQSGAVFRMTADGAATTIASIPSSSPFQYPQYGIAVDADGTLVGGVVHPIGIYSSGSVFRVPLPATGYQVIYDFGGTQPVMYPSSELVQTADGTLWGTAGGGVAGKGTVFRLSGGPQIAYEFSGAADGASPGNLFAAPDGNLYGVTAGEGPGGAGTIFRLDSVGTFSTLHPFSGPDGSEPAGGLMQANDGNFYGTTAFGGANGGGTLFRLTSAATHMKLHDFQANAVPEEPRGRIIQATDGMLYFTGFGFRGTLFRSDLNGNVTDIHDFCCQDGESPPAGVVQGDDGKLYGTTRYYGGAAQSLGTVFRFTLPSTYEVLHSFDDHGRTLGGVVEGGDGRFYGTATPEMSGGHGGVFGIDAAGTNFGWIRLLTFWDGDTPAASLLRAADGMLYGTTQFGGESGLGVVFRVDLGSAPPSLADLSPASGIASGGVAMTLSGDHFRTGISASFGGTAATVQSPYDAHTHIAVTPPLTPGTIYDVTVTNTDNQSATLPQAYFADYLDSPTGSLFHDEIEAFLRDGITAGCGGGSYCVNAAVTRAQMAVFVLKFEHGSSYVPPPCTGVFPDVACPSMFADWIEQFAMEKVTAGCGNGLYCPQGTIPRENAAVFLLKAEHGGSYVPPPCQGVFADVPCPSTYADWIEQLAAEGVSSGCGNGNYCPDANTTRGQIAAFLENVPSPP